MNSFTFVSETSQNLFGTDMDGFPRTVYFLLESGFFVNKNLSMQKNGEKAAIKMLSARKIPNKNNKKDVKVQFTQIRKIHFFSLTFGAIHQSEFCCEVPSFVLL